MRVTAIGIEALDDFLGLSRTLQGGDPRWIAPLDAQLRQELTASAFDRHGRKQLLLAEHGGRVVGRVVALVNDDLRDEAGAPLGQLGYFEAIDDPAVAAAVFDAGADWLRAQGARELLGPINGGAHRTHRLMVKGFDREPFLFEPRNPAYYPRLFEAWGARPVHRWFSYELELPAIRKLRDRFGRVHDGRPLGGSMAALDPRDIPRAIARIHPLLDGFWQGHIGYASIAPDEFAEAFAGALSIMTWRNFCIYIEDERDLGCAFMYPDYAAEVRALAGDASRWGHWLASGRLPRRLVMHTLALLPQIRMTSAPLALIEAGLHQLEKDGYQELLVALVVEGLLGKQLGEPTREYALYGRKI